MTPNTDAPQTIRMGMTLEELHKAREHARRVAEQARHTVLTWDAWAELLKHAISLHPENETVPEAPNGEPFSGHGDSRSWR